MPNEVAINEYLVSNFKYSTVKARPHKSVAELNAATKSSIKLQQLY